MKKKKNVKEYKVSLDSEMFAVSLVEHPAIESDFMAFSKDSEKQEMVFSNDEKHNVCGAVLIPDKSIYRNNGEEEYYITFSKESIEKLSRDYLKGLRQNNITLEHSEDADGISLCEMWIKSDMYKDKSVAMGLSEDLPVGTLFATYHIDSIELWDKVKSGELKGFSIEAMIGLDEMNFSKEEEDMNFWQKMNDLLVSTLGMRDNSKKEEQTEVEMAEETPQEAPQATETAEVVEEPIQEEKTPTEEANEVVETPVVEEAPKPNEDLTKLQELVENLKAELNALKEQNTTLEVKVKEMGKQPSAKPLNTAKGSSSKGTTYAEWREAMSKMF